METLDIIIMTILIVVVGLIIGLNIVGVVDKKLGNIQVNIPPIPRPSVVVKINKNCKDPNYNVYIEHDIVKPEQEAKQEIIEKFESVKQEVIQENKPFGEIPKIQPKSILQEKCHKPERIEKNGYICYRKDTMPTDIQSLYSNKYTYNVMEDKYIKGWNLEDYTDKGTINDLGKINLDNFDKYPQPVYSR